MGLKSITYWVGWYNLTGKQYIATKSKKIDLEPGLYNFNDIKQIFANESISLSVNNTNNAVVEWLEHLAVVRRFESRSGQKTGKLSLSTQQRMGTWLTSGKV